MPRPVSDRIVSIRLSLSKDNVATIINVYAPTITYPYENKDAFYNQLARVLSGIPRTDKLLRIGDFNAMLGRDIDKVALVFCKRGIGKCNSHGERPLPLCSDSDERKTTFIHPRSGQWHMIDFIVKRCPDKMDNHSVKLPT